ncbi:MAG: hypothetical protein O8C64_05745 [Candidatus Methanoperedens sp.]|nr:hypothetical protein [Candidatus Methanoperedens sp.]MCZ7405342.1 hypothetical protein [Candidatus Methanoperedens sp.]
MKEINVLKKINEKISGLNRRGSVKDAVDGTKSDRRILLFKSEIGKLITFYSKRLSYYPKDSMLSTEDFTAPMVAQMLNKVTFNYNVFSD